MDTTEEMEQQQRYLRDLHRWHMQRFVSLGFNRGQSERLELEGVDWHDAEHLIVRGCTHKTAMLILL